MAQTKEECLVFLNEARDALDELSLLEEQEKQLSQEETRLEECLEAEKKLMEDTIQKTIKTRREEIRATYEKEMDKAQSQLKKMRSKREKAKNEGIKGRILEETRPFMEEIRELKMQMKGLIRQNHVPGYCQSALYYGLYFPRHLKEYMMLILYVLIFFLMIPWGVYLLIPERKPLYLTVVYFVDILVVGGGYLAIGNRTKMLYMETLREGRKYQDQIWENKKKIKKTTSAIRRDRNESLYNLEKFDDEIARLQQELSDVASKQKDALNAFETVTKNILTDEIEHNHKEKLDHLQEKYQQVSAELRSVMQQMKEKRMHVTGCYGTYLGQEFMDAQKIVQLSELVREGRASNVSEAISVYKAQGQKNQGAR
ncbi:MAG: hypothetical protein HFG54_11325 [Lachnospiraceae bacterium]|jgi:hypothetical protein|nr:hypothetical protein [Lachnospiraceae bacterium]